MTNIQSFGPNCTLGEGPLWHPVRERLFWFDIPAGNLYSVDAYGNHQRSWNFGEPASAAGWIDRETLVVAAASGLQKFDLLHGQWVTLVEMEADNSVTRSNDGRTGPGGAFWIGTMGRELEDRAGAYYRYSGGSLYLLFDQVSIPNATCFSPDGSTAYLADTKRQKIWKWQLDETGAPVDEREIFVDLQAENLNPDGAVCDEEGFLWNAQWGASRLARYAPDGSLDRVVDLPVSQPTCPAFGGDDLATLFVTSASENLSPSQLAKEPDAGKVLMLDVGVKGLPEHQVVI